MNIEDLTIRQARELASVLQTNGGKTQSMVVGEAYLIRTVTYFYTGRVTHVTDSDIELSDAAWIPDTGRFGDALKSGKFHEVEPYPDKCYVSRAAIVDFSIWMHLLPREQK